MLKMIHHKLFTKSFAEWKSLDDFHVQVNVSLNLPEAKHIIIKVRHLCLFHYIKYYWLYLLPIWTNQDFHIDNKNHQLPHHLLLMYVSLHLLFYLLYWLSFTWVSDNTQCTVHLFVSTNDSQNWSIHQRFYNSNTAIQIKFLSHKNGTTSDARKPKLTD